MGSNGFASFYKEGFSVKESTTQSKLGYYHLPSAQERRDKETEREREREMGEGRRILAARNASEAVKAGLKAAAVTSVVTAIPTVLAVRLIPWARVNLNPTAQALIVSIAAGSAYFIVADQQILHHARANSSHQRMHGQKVEHP